MIETIPHNTHKGSLYGQSTAIRSLTGAILLGAFLLWGGPLVDPASADPNLASSSSPVSSPPSTPKTSLSPSTSPGFFPALSFAHHWIAGVKVGAGIPTQNVDSVDTPSSPNLYANGSVFYGLNEHWLVGANVDWNALSVETPIGNMGSFETVALIPSVEYRMGVHGRWSPYLTAGVGMNANMFSSSGTCPSGASGCTVSPQDALGGRLAIGTDWFLRPGLAVSAEAGYLFDMTSVTDRTAGVPSSGTINSNTVFLLVGLDFKVH